MKLEMIKQIIAEVMQISMDRITENSDLERDLDADSLEIVRILARMEQLYDCSIDIEDLGMPVFVQDLLDYC